MAHYAVNTFKWSQTRKLSGKYHRHVYHNLKHNDERRVAVMLRQDDTGALNYISNAYVSLYRKEEKRLE